jgi:hypothetical protein
VHIVRVHDLPFMSHIATMGRLISPVGQEAGASSGANSGRNRPSR